MAENAPYLLFVDSIIRPHTVSRTWKLCRSFLDAFANLYPDYKVRHRVLTQENLLPSVNEDIARLSRIKPAEEPDHELFLYAKEFAGADCILIGAPYWDFSFPALLKTYMEKVCVSGVTFIYENDRPQGLCRAKELVYLTSCGGHAEGFDLGSDYIKKMCSTLLGVRHCSSLAVDKLDIIGMDTESIMKEGCRQAAEAARKLKLS